MKILTEDLYWSLSHRDKKVYKLGFELWVRQWLCNPAPATTEEVLAWQNNKRLLKCISAEKIEQRGREAILAVIANVPWLNYDRIDCVLSVISAQGGDQAKRFRVLFLIAVINRLFADMNNIWKSNHKLAKKALGYIALLPANVDHETLHYLVPMAMQIPEVYAILKKEIKGAIELGSCGKLVDDLLDIAYVRREKNYDLLQLALLVTHKSGIEFFDYLLSLQQFNFKSDVDSSMIKEQSLKIIANHGVFIDKEWFDFLAFATSSFDDKNVCYFGIEWRLKVCTLLLERINAKQERQPSEFLAGLQKLAKDTAVHGLNKQYLPLFKKFIKKFPKYKTQVLEVIDIILRSYAKTFELQEDSDDWAIYNISKYCPEAVSLIKYGLQLAMSKDIEADRRWKYTHILLEMILYCPTINPDDYAKKINKMLSNRWCYDNCACQMIQRLTVYVKMGKKDFTNRMLLVKSLLFPIVDKMLSFYYLSEEETVYIAEFCNIYMPLRPDYWKECQARVDRNLKAAAEKERKLQEEQLRVQRLLAAISE